MKKSKNFALLIGTIIVVAVILVVAAGGVWWWGNKIKFPIPNMGQNSNMAPSQTSQSETIPGIFFNIKFKGFDIFLYAPNEVISEAPPYIFCGGNNGSASKEYSGTYQLIAKKDGRTVSILPIGSKDFAVGSRIDGMHIISYAPTGDEFISIAQYGSCSGDLQSFYAINDKQQLVNVSFLHNDTSVSELFGGFQKNKSRAITDGTFCWYNNAGLVGNYCDVYKYSNYKFIRTDAWYGAKDEIGRAKRFIADFSHSDKIKPYLPKLPMGSLIFADEISSIQTSTLPYKFSVNFTDMHNNYKYIFEVKKSQSGFEPASPPKMISNP